MKNQVEIKLEKISTVWNYFILEHQFCKRKIKFNKDVKTNYFGDIIGYFTDTLDIAFAQGSDASHSEKFKFTISFLQAIYIQQDFILEMLEIFKVRINKRDLKNDLTYTINRNIRNELVGHPIRKIEGNLISSTLFSYQTSNDKIQYIRYHRDNNFKFESVIYKIIDIQARHTEFLEKYLDTILAKLTAITSGFLKELDKLESVIEKNDFNTVLTLTNLFFESIFMSDYAYDKSCLLKIYARRDEHIRYGYFIHRFYKDLKSSITDTRAFAEKIFEKESSLQEIALSERKNIKSLFEIPQREKKRKETYHYELGKLATKRNLRDFEFFGGMLKDNCQDNQLVISELNHMNLNIHDDIEYYTALRLIYKELNDE